MAASTPDVVARALQASQEMDFEALLALMAPDVLVEWPYHPPGVPGHLRGREDIRTYLRAAGRAPIRWDAYTDLVVHETTDPEVAIAEYQALGRVTTTGRPYRQRVIAVFRVRDGEIHSYRDYLDPLALAQARAELPAMTKAVAGG
ncbi:SnoaL-like domain-containing protein [Frankia sp. AiPs1]|uniref:nuclear transport factor 2 family protein n=1 Tax=Frankia sp. AiPa1 TaxID=573492 RepID=UPI00202B5E0E|nr:nuclear transport factor 2 family protein [Frankia sp. AiPa1]MCL9762873.1 nuclear transport factor 2 family protein [Frankia sp. AiPa1]